MTTSKLSIRASDCFTPGMPAVSSAGKPIGHDQNLAGPSVSQRALVAVLGLSMVVAGPCLFFFNIENQGWTWVIALITTWLGMSLLVLLWLAGCRHPEIYEKGPEDQSVAPAAGSVIHLNPLMETFAELGRQTNSRSVVLLSAEGAAWCLRMAWNCSQVYGSNIAHLLEGRVQSGTQSLQYLALMDGTVSSFCTPIHLKSGSSLLLVLINEANHTMLYNTPSLAFQASLKIVAQLGNAKHTESARGCAGTFPASRKTLCCSVCDSLSTQDGRWIPWGDWLNETYGTTREFTFCDNCSQWIYGLDASELRAA
jgi:hypothetical protein